MSFLLALSFGLWKEYPPVRLPARLFREVGHVFSSSFLPPSFRRRSIKATAAEKKGDPGPSAKGDLAWAVIFRLLPLLFVFHFHLFSFCHDARGVYVREPIVGHLVRVDTPSSQALPFDSELVFFFFHWITGWGPVLARFILLASPSAAWA